MRRGNCYVACEALYHLVGGKVSGWTPNVMRLMLLTIVLAACGDTPTSATFTPSAPPPAVQAPPLELRGSVTFFDLERVGNPSYLNVVYDVTTFSSRDIEKCYVTVRWLDFAGAEIAFNYLPAGRVPQGYSEKRSADWHLKRVAESIKNSRVEYECFGEGA